MSDSWLQFVPSDPDYQPSPEAAECARVLLAAFTPKADTVSVEFTESVQFFHPGSNWSGVKCSACDADAESWWNSAIESADQNGFRSLMTTAPCCGARVSLNDLRYPWPAAFGRFVLEAMNPNVGDLLPAEEAQLRTALGCELRKVWVHI
jgi:hypothetical protein